MRFIIHARLNVYTVQRVRKEGGKKKERKKPPQMSPSKFSPERMEGKPLRVRKSFHGVPWHTLLVLGGEAPRRELDKDTKPGLAWPGGREDEDNRNSHLCHADRAASFVLPLGGRPADGSPAIRWSSAETNLHRPESSAQCAHDASRHKSI